jgi:hypothetical protein
MNRPARSLLIAALLALSVTIWLPRLRGPIDLRWDGGTYFVLGTSLAEGRGYRLLSEPGEIEAVQYPPLLPAIVAIHQWILRTSDPMIVGHWLRLTFFVMFLLSVIATYALFERVLSAGWAFVAVVMCVLNLFSMFLTELLFAELPFLLASVLFVLWSGASGSRERPFLSGLCATLAYLLRTAGVALLVAWMGESLVRKEFKRAAIRGVIALVPILGWQTYIADVQASASYAHPSYPYQRAEYVFYNVTYAENLFLRDPFQPELGKASLRNLVGRVARNLTQLPQSIGEAVSADKGDWYDLVDRLPGAHTRPPAYVRSWAVFVVLTGLGTLVLAGVTIQLGGSGRLMALYVMAYSAMVCLTPWPAQWRRYWFPLAPLLVLGLYQCLLWLGRRRALVATAAGRLAARVLLPGVVAIVLVVELFAVLHAYRTIRGEVMLRDQQGSPLRFSLFFYGQPDRERDEALEWLRGRGRPGDVVASAMPHWAHLLTGMKTVVPPFERDPAKAEALLDSVPVRFIVMDADIVRLMRESAGTILGADGHWTRIYTSSSGLVAVYERAPVVRPAKAGAAKPKP